MNWERWLEAEGDKEASPDNDAAMNFDRVRDFLSDFDDLPSLFQLIAELKTAQRSAASSRNAVSIATVHSCKGLEFAVVYVAGMIKGTWPVAWGDDSPVDERRVFYVAVTRARDELWFNGYRYKDEDGAKDAEPSPYLKELGLSPTDRIGRAVIASGQMSMLGDNN
jgi:superfamily I DNA/RNA helicase